MKLAFVGKFRCGKTTSVNYFELQNIPFAKGVKDVALALGWNGGKDERGRKALQLIGTDVGRMLNPNIWVDQWLINYCNAGYENIGVDDCRFNNEAQVLKNSGFTIIHITRPRSFWWWIKEIVSLRILRHFHASERGIDKKYINHYITAKDMTELKSELEKLRNKLV